MEWIHFPFKVCNIVFLCSNMLGQMRSCQHLFILMKLKELPTSLLSQILLIMNIIIKFILYKMFLQAIIVRKFQGHVHVTIKAHHPIFNICSCVVVNYSDYPHQITICKSPVDTFKRKLSLEQLISEVCWTSYFSLLYVTWSREMSHLSAIFNFEFSI